MTIHQCYNTLGLSELASDTEVKKAYRKLSLKYHPDRNKEEGARAKFEEITLAKDTIMMFRDGRFAFPNRKAPPKKERPEKFGDVWLTQEEIESARRAYRDRMAYVKRKDAKNRKLSTVFSLIFGIILILILYDYLSKH